MRVPWYWLIDGEIVPVTLEQGMQPGKDRQIITTTYGKGEGPLVSTVFLSTNYGLDDAHPVLFETMIFWEGHELDRTVSRYHTIEAARAGHPEMVALVDAALPPHYRQSHTIHHR